MFSAKILQKKWQSTKKLWLHTRKPLNTKNFKLRKNQRNLVKSQKIKMHQKELPLHFSVLLTKSEILSDLKTQKLLLVKLVKFLDKCGDNLMKVKSKHIKLN